MDSRTITLPPRQQLVAPGKWPIVGEQASAPSLGAWRVNVAGLVRQPLDLSLAELQSFPRVERTIDIHCVTRWSKLAAQFTGVRLADVLGRAEPRPEARFVSFVALSDRGHSTSLPLAEALALETLLAWECDRQPLEPAHGGPLRVVVPGRYFYKSLKWLRTIELLSEDRLGHWERTAGYHNTGDPWREQRYLASQLSRSEMQALLASRDFAGRDLRGLDARRHNLTGLNAARALLRDADFSGCQLADANFRSANLSNAHLIGALLTGASFAQADVEGADFSGADLRGADFTDASLLGVTFFTVPSNEGDAAVAAIVDATTQFSATALETLAPPQAEFIRRRQ